MKPLVSRPLCVVGLVFLAAAIVYSAPARSHPHVFIDNVAFVEFEDGKIKALRLRWTFDEIFSFLLFEDFDKNKDKAFGAGETEALRKGAFEALKELSYFTHIRIGGELKPLERVTDFKASADKGRVTYEFVAPLDKPVDPRATDVTFGVYDETFYVSVAHDPIDPVRLNGPGSGACHFKIVKDEKHPIYFGMVFPQKVDLICQTS